MAGVRVVTDSGADLPVDMQHAHQIQVVPLTITFGEREFRDGVDLSPEEFYKKLGEEPVMPRTTQPSPADFEKVYRPLLEAGHEIVSVHLSAQLSGTLQSANLAAQSLGGSVHVVDSRSASLGIGLLALQAARWAREGRPAREIARDLQAARERLTVFFSVDTLEYLQRNGRIGKAQAFVGGLLNIKPILTLREGIVHPVERVRGSQKAFSRLVDHVVQQVGQQPVRVGVVHGNAPEEAARLAQALQERLSIQELITANLGPTIGTHAGPGTVGVVCYTSA